MTAPDRPRIESLDYLRGLLALSVLVYHYSTWVGLDWFWPLNGLISCLGIYAVSTFYILSGTSLAIVYGRHRVNGAFLREFTIKRLLRITPLFWLASTATLIIPIAKWLLRDDASALPAASVLFWNFSLLFSWLKPEAYVATGAWSIGNELYFYTLFPLFLLFWNRSKWLFVGAIGTTFVFPLWVAVHMLDQQTPLASQWVLYIQPLNQCYFFAGGIAIGLARIRTPKVPTIVLWLVSMVSIGILASASANVDQIKYVTGFNRILFSAAAFAMCWVAANWNQRHNVILTTSMHFLGITSYSLYLIHPIVFSICRSINFKICHLPLAVMAFCVALPASLLASKCSYAFIERPAMNWAKHLCRKA